MIRRLVPLSLVPLAMIAGVLAATPWLHSFPASAIGIPVFGAAVLSALVPAVAVQLGLTRPWLSLLVDVICFVVYTLLVVLRDPFGFAALGHGLYDGPSQILTFALPLVSPRSLFVAPVALAWLAGALAGEALTRRWFTIVPYPAFLAAYGLAYAATIRGAGFAGTVTRAGETVVAALLLAVLLLLRVAQTWVRQDETAEATQADGILPLRGLTVGAVAAVAVAAVAAACVQAPAFPGHRATPQRVPSVHDSRPLSPVAFVGSMRPSNPKAAGTPVFTVQTDRAAPGYFDIANSDDYDGAGWSFQRTFRPSGGVLPADVDSELTAPAHTVTQTYRINAGALAGQPWMPYLYRPQRVTGTSVNIDPGSGMIVPAAVLRAGERYRVTSQVSAARFAQLPTTAAIATGTASNGTVPPALTDTVNLLARSFSQQTGTPLTPAVGFLQAVQRELHSDYSLSGGTPSAAPATSPTAATTPPSSPARPGRWAPAQARAPPSPSTPVVTVTPGARAGSAGFADVLASVMSPDRTGTPEQYATLVALIARSVGVPARVVSGFRVRAPGGGATLPAGTYTVTTADAWTWVEVPVTGVGWVVLDAAPSSYSGGRQAPSVTARPSPSPTAPPTQNALVTQSNGGHAIAPHSPVPGTGASSIRAAVLSLLIAFGTLLLGLLVLLGVRKPLRRRRRRGLVEPRARVIAAWQESIDVLTEAGLPDPRGLSGTEIVDLTDAEFGAPAAEQARRVSAGAQAAAYSATAVITPTDAETAWAAEQQLRRQLAETLPWTGRITAWLSYHRDRPATKIAPRSGSHRRTH
jgi:transglutaminase-like putative cysteine protease